MIKTLFTAVKILWLRTGRLLKAAILLLFLMWAAITVYVGAVFDETCIEGRISAEQATMLNATDWERCPKYRMGECKAAKNDRVLVGQCSEFFKFLWRPSKWWPAIREWEFPWQYEEEQPSSLF